MEKEWKSSTRHNEKRMRKICKMIVLVLGILSINNIILTIRNYSYAYFEKNVKTGVKLKITTLDEMPVKGEIATKVVKDTVVPYATANSSSFDGGLVAINSNGTLYNETVSSGTIREYRYTGLNVNNYIYYNCKDNEKPNADNCEVWRIIGIFKDEEGGEHLKIVNNKVLTRDMFPVTFVANGTTYNIQSTISNDYAYWNYKTSGTNNNDWATAGLQYWLNGGEKVETKLASDGYMSYLSQNAKNMIEETKYYLGNIVYAKDTAISAYIHERGRTTCSDECSGGDVWSGNSAIWPGKIALMYPSDYGYTASSSNWSSKEIYNYDDGTSDTSWIRQNANHSIHEWFLSPASNDYSRVAAWNGLGALYSNTVSYSYNGGVRPTLYLNSQAIIFDGEGTSEKPYRVKLGN